MIAFKHAGECWHPASLFVAQAGSAIPAFAGMTAGGQEAWSDPCVI